MRYFSSSVAFACAIVCSSPLAAQSTTLTATFSRGAIAEYSGNPNGTDNARLFSSLGIASMTISQQSNNGSWGGTQGNDTSVTAKITFTNGTSTTFPAAINWVKNAGQGDFDWVGLTIGAGTNVPDGYPLTTGREKTYILQFAQSSFDMTAAVQADPDSLDGSANAGAAINALNLYFPTSVAAAPVVSPNQTFSYAENRTAGDTIGTVAATDNVGVTQFRFAATGTQTSADGYYVISNAGVIQITTAGVAAGIANNDFEVTPNSFTYAVEAANANNNWSAPTNVVLNVTNVDEVAPVVTAGQSFNYAENQVANAQVGTVLATDAGGVTGFRFANGTQTSSDGYYTIDNNGVVRITPTGVAAGLANNDFEVAPNSFSYAVQARDAAGNWSASETISLNVTDVADEAAPVVTAGQSFSYAENRAANDTVATVLASDDVAVTQFRFAATNSQTSADGYYTINNAGVVQITANGIAAGIANNDFETAPNSFNYAIQAGDAANNWSVATNITLNVTDGDETAPAITAGQSFAYAENRAAGALLGTVAASDNVAVTDFRFSGSGTQTSADGFFAINSSGQITLTATGAAAGAATNDFETAPNSFSLGVQARDAAGNWSASTSVTLNVTDVNEVVNAAPVITAGQVLNYAENRSAGAIVGTVGASDDVGVTAFRFAATGTQTSADNHYTIDNNGIVRITAAGVAANVANNDFEVAPNSFTYAIEAGDSNGAWSAPASVTLNVTNLDDDAPQIAAGQNFTYAEGQAAGALLATIQASDDTAVTGFRFAATGSSTSANGFFAVDSSGNIRLTPTGAAAGAASNDFETAPNSFILGLQARDAAGNWSSTVDVGLNVTDMDDSAPTIFLAQRFAYAENQSPNFVVGTVAAADDVAVTAFRFAGTGTQTSEDGFYAIDNAGTIRLTAAGAAAGAPSNDFETAPNSFTYAIEAGDAAGNWSAPVNVSLSVTDRADMPPVITGPDGSPGSVSSINVPEGTIAVTQVTSSVPGSTWAITGGNDQGRFAIDGNGNLVFTAKPDFEAPADSDTDNSYVLVIEATAPDGSRSSQTITVNVTNIADTPPVITGPGGSTGNASTISVPEGTTAVTRVTSSVPGSTWAIAGGNDQGRFAIDGNGNLVFTAKPDFEAPADSDTNNSYVLVIEATAPDGSRSTQTITVNVTNIADTPPAITVPGGSASGGGQVISVPEGTTAVTQVTSSVPGSTWTIAGGNDQGRFAIDGNGNLVFTARPDFEAPADSDTNNSYVLVIEATAPDGSKASQTVTVNVTNVADMPPAISTPSGSATISVPENQTAVTRITSSVAGTSWAITSGDDQGQFSIDGNGNLVFTAAPDFDAPADVGRDNIYVLVVEATAPDGSKSTQTITVNVTNVADMPPVIGGPGGASGASATISVPENQTAVTQLTSSVPGSTWTITSGDDRGQFSIDANGRLVFTAAPDFDAPSDRDTNNSYVLVVEATAPDGSKSAQTITVNVTNLADMPPVISGPNGASGNAATISVPENQTVVTQVATSVPGATWAIISGNDRGRFAIDAEGRITFVAAPDFEAPADSDTNNSYVLVIEATAPDGSKSTQTITVNVTNVADTPPVITGPSGGAGASASSVAVNEGTVAVTSLASNRPVTWSIIGGTDRQHFSINAQGQISFVSAPNFEAPTDSDRNNSYVLIVEAVDANGERAQQTITVTVLNVDELQRKLNEIGANLRGGVRNHAFASLSSMLSFNEGLLGLDGQCASAGSRRPLSGGLEANENRQDARLRFARDLSSCEARTRIFADGGVAFSRVEQNWTMRGLASARLEHLVGSRTLLGAALIGTAASDELGAFGDSRISDESVQVNLYGRTHLSEGLRFAAFAGLGRAWYQFRLEDGGLDLDGEATGKRHLYGAALSGDIRFGGLTVTTDAILSRAVEKLGHATLDASFAGESGRDMLFRLGRVDITRLSVPVHVPILFGAPKDGREATRLDISPGLLCQDTAADSSALDCGYQLGFKFRLAPTLRSLLRAEARTEAVDGYLLNSLTFGFQRRFGSLEQMSWGMDASRTAGGNRDEKRLMFRVGLGR